MMDIDPQFPSLLMQQKIMVDKYYVMNRSLIKNFIVKNQEEDEKE